jgi:hypothetical protein
VFKNVGKIDKFVRMFGGAALIVAGILTGFFVISIVGFLFFLSGATQFCLLYKLLGISTLCQLEDKNCAN